MTRSMIRMIASCWAFALCGAASATDLSNNLGNLTAGTEAASASRSLGASFGTDGSAHTLSSVTLKLSATAGGSCIVSLHSNGGLRPGAPIAILNSPALLPETLGTAVFTADSVALTPSTTYWLVLTPTSGTITWAWTADDAGLGAGFQKTWGVSDDAGVMWWSIDCYQTQMAVSVDVCSAPGVTQDPAPVSACTGAEVSFTVAGSGTGPLGYAWFKDGDPTPIADSKHYSGATTGTLVIHGVSSEDIGSYTARISNGCGQATSAPAVLGVCATDWDCNGTVNSTDVSAFINTWFDDQVAGTLASDFDGNGVVNSTDVSEFINAWFEEQAQACAE